MLVVWVARTRQPYEEAVDLDALKGKLDTAMTDYNLEPGFLPMELVLFRDAVRHVCRIQVRRLTVLRVCVAPWPSGLAWDGFPVDL